MTSDPYHKQELPNPAAAFRMVKVPGGSFLMGSPDTDKEAREGETPQHEVKLDTFWMGEHTVTQALWETILGGNPSDFKGPQRPVENVRWLNAAVFCNALGEKTGRSPVYLNKNGQIFGKEKDKWALPDNGEVRRDLKASGYACPQKRNGGL